MSEAEKKIKELKQLMGKTDEQSVAERARIANWLKSNDSDEVQTLFDQFMEEGLAEINEDINKLRIQAASDYELLPISYIARHYFGKSSAWLQQRINGYPVRGKVYGLNEEQKATFNSAVQDIARRIKSVRIV